MGSGSHSCSHLHSKPGSTSQRPMSEQQRPPLKTEVQESLPIPCSPQGSGGTTFHLSNEKIHWSLTPFFLLMQKNSQTHLPALPPPSPGVFPLLSISSQAAPTLSASQISTPLKLPVAFPLHLPSVAKPKWISSHRKKRGKVGKQQGALYFSNVPVLTLPRDYRKKEEKVIQK